MRRDKKRRERGEKTDRPTLKSQATITEAPPESLPRHSPGVAGCVGELGSLIEEDPGMITGELENWTPKSSLAEHTSNPGTGKAEAERLLLGLRACQLHRLA